PRSAVALRLRAAVMLTDTAATDVPQPTLQIPRAGAVSDGSRVKPEPDPERHAAHHGADTEPDLNALRVGDARHRAERESGGRDDRNQPLLVLHRNCLPRVRVTTRRRKSPRRPVRTVATPRTVGSFRNTIGRNCGAVTSRSETD